MKRSSAVSAEERALETRHVTSLTNQLMSNSETYVVILDVHTNLQTDFLCFL